MTGCGIQTPIAAVQDQCDSASDGRTHRAVFPAHVSVWKKTSASPLLSLYQPIIIVCKMRIKCNVARKYNQHLICILWGGTMTTHNIRGRRCGGGKQIVSVGTAAYSVLLWFFFCDQAADAVIFPETGKPGREGLAFLWSAELPSRTAGLPVPARWRYRSGCCACQAPAGAGEFRRPPTQPAGRRIGFRPAGAARPAWGQCP